MGVAARLGTTRETVGKWRRRFIEKGCDGLLDEPRPGAPRTVSDAGCRTGGDDDARVDAAGSHASGVRARWRRRAA